MLKKVLFGLFAFLITVSPTVYGQAKMDRTKPLGAAAASRKNIVEAAKSEGIFNTLLAAAQAAGWDELLKGRTAYTVFAPTDEAFAKLPAEAVENLLNPENKQMLVKLLTYHIVKGSFSAADVLKMKKAKTVQGQEFKISSRDGVWMIDNARLIKTDIYADNGTIHVIDAVLMPE